MGPHQPDMVFKDNDLTTPLRLPPQAAARAAAALAADSAFLAGQGVMDYSLLVGIHHIQYDVDPFAILAAAAAAGTAGR